MKKILNKNLYQNFSANHRPDDFHHIAFKTTNYEAMVCFYKNLFGCEPLYQSDQMSFGWEYSEWSSLLRILFAITTIFCLYIFLLSKEKRKASLLLSIIFLSIYFISLIYAY